jgi:hypothetical protein
VARIAGNLRVGCMAGPPLNSPDNDANVTTVEIVNGNIEVLKFITDNSIKTCTIARRS